MNILAIGPHPDDIEFGCSPILIKEARSGNQVRMLMLSRGEAGTAGTPEGREEESRSAARLMGASIDFLDFGGDWPATCNIRRRMRSGSRRRLESSNRRSCSRRIRRRISIQIIRSLEDWCATRAGSLVMAVLRN